MRGRYSWPVAFYPRVVALDELGAPSVGEGAALEAWATRQGDANATVTEGDSGVRTIYAETTWVVRKFGLEDLTVEWTMRELRNGQSYDIVGVQDRHDDLVVTAIRRDARRAYS